MKAGGELDALVAEKVMGLGVVMKIGPFTGEQYAWHTNEKEGGIPHYSTDIAAAWQVVEKMSTEGYSRSNMLTTDAGIFASFEMWPDGAKWPRNFVATGRSVPHAICLAALRAKGIEVE